MNDFQKNLSNRNNLSFVSLPSLIHFLFCLAKNLSSSWEDYIRESKSGVRNTAMARYDYWLITKKPSTGQSPYFWKKVVLFLFLKELGLMDDYDGMYVEDENKYLYHQEFLTVSLELLFENHCMFIGQVGPRQSSPSPRDWRKKILEFLSQDILEISPGRTTSLVSFPPLEQQFFLRKEKKRN